MEENTRKYLLALSENYPTALAVRIRLTELNTMLNLPKGTEHFMSDLHGEADAFLHIRKSASGVIKNKIRRIFSGRISEEKLAELATVIYYPNEKLLEIGEKGDDEWYETTVYRIIEILRKVGERYSIKDFIARIVGKVRGFEHHIVQIVWDNRSDEYFKTIITKSVMHSGARLDFLCAISEAVRILVVDRLHIVGDLFDRGARPDIIIDELTRERVDIEWGNHDVLWMGAAAGSAPCISAVMSNSLNYSNLDALEFGYGISLRPLAAFAEEVYKECDASIFTPRGEISNSRDKNLITKMNKAMAIIRFKTEGECIMRNPEFMMNERLLLNEINKKDGTVRIQGKIYRLRDSYLPTVSEENPYELTSGERELIEYYKAAFTGSIRLRSQVEFLYRAGSIYRIYNGNLLFHGCIPLEENGELMKLGAAKGLCGREMMDFCDRVARDGYFAEVGSLKRRRGEDFLWFLGCGKNSPLFGREKMATFERFFLSDETIKKEPKNAYYKIAWERRDIAEKILSNFGLYSGNAHIINGHIPQNHGENPIKAGGKIIVIDGGFCSAFHNTVGVAGYTLIYNAEGMRLSAHAPFKGVEDAVKNNGDILSETSIFETRERKIRVRETDLGRTIREEMCDLMMLLDAYENGDIPEQK